LARLYRPTIKKRLALVVDEISAVGADLNGAKNGGPNREIEKKSNPQEYNYSQPMLFHKAPFILFLQIII
jgi:hypothetical protein